MMKHELDMCCGTTCNKQANLEYVKQLEQERDELISIANCILLAWEGSETYRNAVDKLAEHSRKRNEASKS